MKAYSNDHFSAVMPTPFGKMGIRTQEGKLRQLVYLPWNYPVLEAVDVVAKAAVEQIERYLTKPDFRFDLPLMAVGTPFQQRVWTVIDAIPAGQASTYGEVAHALRSAPRAVGQACGANWFPLVIPCHRVTAAGGLGGFSNQSDAAGFYLGVKRWLLAHEGIVGY